MTAVLTPAEHADNVVAALERMLAFVTACGQQDWHARPLRGQGDARPVCVIADHVAHAYEYMGSWVGEIVAGGEPAIDVALVDELNAEHAGRAELVTRADVAGHLRRSGDAFAATIRDLTPSDLELADGRVRRFAEIAASHADTHRAEIETALRG